MGFEPMVTRTPQQLWPTRTRPPEGGLEQNGIGGRYGIRTHGDPEATTAFEAAPFVRSGNLPQTRLAVCRPGADERIWVNRSTSDNPVADRRKQPNGSIVANQLVLIEDCSGDHEALPVGCLDDPR